MRNEKYPASHSDKNNSDDKMMEGVYAGPDFFAQQNPQMFQTVYAGPDFYTQPNPQMFQAAYAGPDYYTQNPRGMCAPAPEQADIKPKKRCSNCGSTIDAVAKFCPECGTPQDTETNPHKYCIRCGAELIPEGTKYCQECGTPQLRSDA